MLDFNPENDSRRSIGGLNKSLTGTKKKKKKSTGNKINVE
jgi:hypothetical protein